MTTETTIHTNEPGKVLPVLVRELDDFDTEALKFLRGEFDESKFIGFRLKQGVYGQRQPGVQMIRVKLPFGGVTADQLDAFGEITEHITPLRKGHLTTRENVQLHHIPLIRAMKALKILGAVGLSTREACGNTVRNVTGDPWAGVNANEPFDPTPYAGAFARYWLRNPLTQLLPRKFKVAFSSDDSDQAITGLHDLGFIPRMEGGRKGFKIVVAGGLSTMPRNAHTLREFSPVEEYLRVSEAVLRIFERCDELRKNRNKARIKFYVERIGFPAFKAEVDKELEGEWAKRDFSPDHLLYIDDEEGDPPGRRPAYQTANGDLREFAAFVSTNVRAQKQQGFSTIEVHVPKGDLSPEQFRGLATILREYGNGRARATPWQNLVLRWIRDEGLYEVWQRLREIELGDSGAHEITDIVSCPGTDSCKLGITSSMGLNGAIRERVQQMNVTDPLTRRIHIKMSGCPNS
ncbi:MAG: nitrite/sulfite reductase, partial [Dehalococcoidia bacterium]